MRVVRATLVVGVAAITAGPIACADVLDLGSFKNECGEPVDSPCDGGVLCQPGQQESCYTGDPSTKDKGICKSGMRTCGSNGLFGECVGEVLPMAEEISPATVSTTIATANRTTCVRARRARSTSASAATRTCKTSATARAEWRSARATG